jgi:hypothetical protein
MEVDYGTPSQGYSLDSQESASSIGELTDIDLKSSLIFFSSHGEEETAVLVNGALPTAEHVETTPLLETEVAQSYEEVDVKSPEAGQNAAGLEVRTAEVHEEADELPAAVETAPVQAFKAEECIAVVDDLPPAAEVKPAHEIKATLSEEAPQSHEMLAQPTRPADSPLASLPRPDKPASPSPMTEYPPIESPPHQSHVATKVPSYQETRPVISQALKPDHRAEKEVTTQAESGPVSQMGDCASAKQNMSSRVAVSGEGRCAKCSLQ